MNTLLLGATGSLGKEINKRICEGKDKIITVDPRNRNINYVKKIVSQFKVDFFINTSVCYLGTPSSTAVNCDWPLEIFENILNFNHDANMIGFGSYFEDISIREGPIKSYVQDKLMFKQKSLSRYGRERIMNFKIFQAYSNYSKPHKFDGYIFTSLKNNEDITIKNPNKMHDWVWSRDIANIVYHCMKNRKSFLEFADHDQSIDIGTGILTDVFGFVNQAKTLSGSTSKLTFELSPEISAMDGNIDGLAARNSGFPRSLIPQTNLCSGLRKIFGGKN